MNPTDLARERWKPFREAQEWIETAAAAHAQAREHLAELEAQLGAAKRDDELALEPRADTRCLAAGSTQQLEARYIRRAAPPSLPRKKGADAAEDNKQAGGCPMLPPWGSGGMPAPSSQMVPVASHREPA